MGTQDEHPIGTPSALPAGATPGKSPGAIPAFLLNLLAGCRLALMLPVRRESFRGGLHQAVLLILGAVAFNVAVQYVEIPARRGFNIYGFSRELAVYAIMLLAAYCAVGVQRASATLGTFLVLTVSALPLVWAAWAMARAFVPLEFRYSDGGSLFFICFAIVWPMAIAYRAVRLLHDAEPAKALVVAGIYAALFVGPSYLLPQVPMWISLGPPTEAVDEETTASRIPIDVEGAYYRQARLLDDALKALHRNRPGVADLYFVGFGGYAHQDVFLREVQAVHDLFDERFDTTNRSVELINNPATLEDTPLANAHNLETVLGDVARRMDVDEDILFLFLTSHGSRDHRLSADFWPLGLNDLPAEGLADILDRTGIKWRVVVVSACYSGGFIDSLADENSLIMTASRSDRNSFGCAHENDWTYFGQAYFDEQLRTEYSFTTAFEAAADAIAAREEDEELTPSEPQIHVGAAIADRLQALQVRIETGDTSAPSN